MELEGDGVADLLAGGDGDVWGMLAPPRFSPSWALSWDWLMVVSWAGGMTPEWAVSVMWMMDLMIKEGSCRYCDTCVWLWSCKDNRGEEGNSFNFPKYQRTYGVWAAMGKMGERRKKIPTSSYKISRGDAGQVTTINNTVVHIWKLLRDKILKVLITEKTSFS